MKYTIKKGTNWNNKSYYHITFKDKNLFFLSNILSELSTDIAMNYGKRITPLIEFYNSKDKLKYSETKLGGTWSDYPYPDEKIVVWPNMDTTKNNLGLMVTLLSGDNIPSIMYSFTWNKIYIGNVHPRYLGNDESPPLLYETTLYELVERIEWWIKYIKKMEVGEINLDGLKA
jgi:hypothetical protein